MATIQINDLKPAGTDLFMDSENYLSDLTNDELGNINGGLPSTIAWTPTSSVSCAVTIATVSTVLITREVLNRD